jgi:dTDP-4-amino-4,6-dideoxygalactose transaminase
MPALKTPVTAPPEFIAFAPPALGPEEIREVVDTLQSPWITTGPKTHRFEEEFRDFLGGPGALAVNSCTAALHTALVALGIGPGDEVITTTMTFVATVNVIEHVGARPVLVDVEPDTLNLDPSAVEAAITPRTRAIIAVHFAGHPAELDELRALASAHDLTLIEDAAHALPAHYRGRLIGATSNPVAFSFYATKNLTTAEGGMLTAHGEFLEHARVIALHGMTRDAWNRYERGGSWRYDVTSPGFKYNMTDVQASLGLWQLRKLRGFHARRAAVAAQYSAAFAEEEALEVPVARPHVGHAWHLYVLRLREEALEIGRDEFIDLLRERNIGASVHFIPVHRHRYYRQKYGFAPDDFPTASAAFERMLSLPLHPRLSDENVGDVIGVVRDLIHAYRR